MKKQAITSKFNELCVDLGLQENSPVLLIGKDAVKFIKNHFSKRKNKVKLSNLNGIFLYENLDESYIEINSIDKRCLENGVICMVKNKKSSLIHEMRHAYQLKNNPEYMFLEQDEELMKAYKKTYVYYPSEEDAFNYAIQCLKEEYENTYKYHLNDGETLDYLVNYWKHKFKMIDYFLYKTNYFSLKLEYHKRNKNFKKDSLNDENTMNIKFL